MLGSGGAAVPVEAILKLALDKAGADDIQKFLDNHEKSWSRIERSVGKIGEHAESLTRMGLGLAGIAGIGAIANNFMQGSQAGSNVALAGGNVVGGAGVWHPYAQSLLGAQSKTGVDRLDIAQGLVLAIQSVGGNPTPQQAMMLGGLIAGYGQTVGMTPAQVSQVISPLLQAANKPLTGANVLSTGAALSGGLTAFPGSQAAPILSLLSQLGVAQALGLGPAGGFTPDLHGLTASINAAAQSNSVWRNPSVTGGAINSISGGLQNAFGNPSQEAFMQLAGISYKRQREGFTPQNMEAITAEATRLYGTGETRDIFLRSMFGLQGADLLEQFSPGSKSWHLLQQGLAHHGSSSALNRQIEHAQQRTTPSATANRFGGGILKWLEASPLHALLGLGGAYGATKLLKGGFKLGGRGLAGLLGGGADAAAADAGATALDDLLVAGLGGAFAGVGAGAATSLIFPDSISVPGSDNKAALSAVRQVVAAAEKKFGKNVGSKRAQKWMWDQFGFRDSVYQDGHGVSGHMAGTPARTHYWDMATGRGEYSHGATVAQQMLTRLFAQFGSGQDPITTFAQAAKQLLQAANQMSTGSAHGASYQLGSGGSQQVSLLGTPGVQQLGALAPGLEFAALTGAAAGSGGGGFVSLAGAGAGAGPGRSTSSSGGGWQTAVASWYDPGAGGINGSWGGGAWSGHPVEPGTYGFAHKTMGFGTQVQFRYKGKTITATCVDRGPFVAGRDFDLLPGPARDLGITGAGVVTLQYRVIGGGGAGGKSASGSAGGTGGHGGDLKAAFAQAGGSPAGEELALLAGAAGAAGGGGGGGGGQPAIHVHTYIDGRKVQTSRVLRGHKP